MFSAWIMDATPRYGQLNVWKACKELRRIHFLSLFLIEVDENTSRNFTSLQLLHALRKLAQPPYFTYRLQQPSPRVLQRRCSILHGTYNGTSDC